MVLNPKIHSEGNIALKRDNESRNKRTSIEKEDDKMSNKTKSFKESEVSSSPKSDYFRKTAKMSETNFMQINQNSYVNGECLECL